MNADKDREMMRRWVETWRAAGPELEKIRRAEIQAADTRLAVDQLFGSGDLADDLPPRLTSGLVEQQAWFARLRK